MPDHPLSADERARVLDLVGAFVDLRVTPFGEPVRGVVRVDRRERMYGGAGVVYLLHLFDSEALASNRLAAYMVMPERGDGSGFHEHGTRREQELYIVLHGEGEYADRDGPEGAVRTVPVCRGSVTAVQRRGEHAIRNTGDEPLIVFVVTTNER